MIIYLTCWMETVFVDFHVHPYDLENLALVYKVALLLT